MKIFRDPIHNVIDLNTGDNTINNMIVQLIDAKEFQRLRFIRQLGFSYLAYPSAMHTRFEHSLGVAFLAKRFLAKIETLEETHPHFSIFFANLRKYKPLTIVAALLHDIGHGPLSHVSEVIVSHFNRENYINHENWTKRIILGNTEINQILTSYNKSYPNIICDMLDNNSKYPCAKILAGQLDVDRIDYLLRDSYMTGSGYGFFDVEWLINVLDIGLINDKIAIGLDLSKGLSVAEDFIMARHYMFKNVYQHKTTLIAQEMLLQLLAKLSQTKSPLQEEFAQTFFNYFYKSKCTLDQYLNFTDIELYSFLKHLQTFDNNIIKALSKGLINRKLLKQIDNNKYHILKKDNDFVCQITAPKKEINIDNIFLFDKNNNHYKLSDYFNIGRSYNNDFLGYFTF